MRSRATNQGLALFPWLSHVIYWSLFRPLLGVRRARAACRKSGRKASLPFLCSRDNRSENPARRESLGDTVRVLWWHNHAEYVFATGSSRRHEIPASRPVKVGRAPIGARGMLDCNGRDPRERIASRCRHSTHFRCGIGNGARGGRQEWRSL